MSVFIEFDKNRERIWITRDDSSYEATYFTLWEWEELISRINSNSLRKNVTNKIARVIPDQDHDENQLKLELDINNE